MAAHKKETSKGRYARDKGGRTIVGKLALAIEYVGCIVLFYWLHTQTRGVSSPPHTYMLYLRYILSETFRFWDYFRKKTRSFLVFWYERKLCSSQPSLQCRMSHLTPRVSTAVWRATRWGRQWARPTWRLQVNIKLSLYGDWILSRFSLTATILSAWWLD